MPGRVLAGLSALALIGPACSSPPPAAPVADLDIQKMPDGGALVAAKAPARDFGMANVGACGDSAPGQAAPPLTPSIKADRITIVFFWATWAHPARMAMEKLQGLYERHRDRVDIIAVSVDDEKTGVFKFAQDHGAMFKITWDEGHRAAECWKITTMPMMFVVDRGGVIRHFYDGYHDGDVDQMERQIEKL